MSKVILELNYKTIFENEEEYIKTLEVYRNNQPEVYEQILKAEQKKEPVLVKLSVPNELSLKRTINVSRMGIA